MYCIKTEIPQEICDIDDELKAIYHSRETVFIWVLKALEDRNRPLLDFSNTGITLSFLSNRLNELPKHFLFKTLRKCLRF
jgi:hypothetical protein